MAQPEGGPDLTGQPSASVTATYHFTFGHYTQSGSWDDVRALTWPALCQTLTTHAVGAKRGPCIVPATFRGTRRQQADADQIEVVFLDSDAGATLEEIEAAVRARGWAAIISSTHSHLSSRTTATAAVWRKFLDTCDDPGGAAAAFLIQRKGYLACVAEGAHIVAETEDEVTFEHQPCPKFRVAIPLLRPWRASDYGDQQTANTAWRQRIKALAAALDLDHDQACTDTSRLFYLPRRPANGPPAETAIIEGEACDIFSLPDAVEVVSDDHSRAQSDGGAAPEADAFTYPDPVTGEVFDLRAWAREHAGDFELVTALQTRRPSVFVGKVSDNTRHHLRCVNEAAHTQAGADTATFIVNASNSTSKGFVYHCRHAHCAGVDRLVFLHKMLEQGWLTVADLTDPAFLAGEAPIRPLIRVVGGMIADTVTAAEAALIAAASDIYQRGAFLVRPGLVSVSVKEGRQVSAQRILVMGEHALVEAFTTVADWERYDARSKGWVRINAPSAVAATYIQRVGQWKLPILAGIINAPTLRADGSILDQPGYDVATGLLLDMRGEVFPPIPRQPSRADALAAITVLGSLIEGFPFVDNASEAVALSAILTGCIRRSIATAPLHAYSAPTPGSGKSMLVDIACLIATGREAGVISQGKTEEELEKRLGALLLAGDLVIAIDNCESPLGGEFLCSMLTQSVVRPRILGRSEAPELPANAMVTATGNNLVLLGDVTRRALLCQIDPQDERPELRKFATDPIAILHEDRGRYLIAALTVLRAYHIAGMPGAPDPIGSFRDWSNWIRGALIWLDYADPVDTIEAARDLDPKLDMLAAVLAEWAAAIGTATTSVRNLIEAATQQRVSAYPVGGQHSKPEFVRPEFREVLLAVAGDGGVINGRRLGKWLAANQGRLVRGQRIRRAGISGGIVQWGLEIAQEVQRAPA